MKPNRLVTAFLVVWVLSRLIGDEPTHADKKRLPPVKSIRGHVMDNRGKSITGAKVFVRNVSKNTTTVLITDENGLFAVYGLDPKVDYEVHAEYGQFVSETKSVSLFLNRYDNVFNFELGPKDSAGVTSASLSTETVTFPTADQVTLVGDWCRPVVGKKEARFPTVLLLHGFGQDRSVWQDFARNQLLPVGFAVLNLDLRGHGASTRQGGSNIAADPSWRSDPTKFCADIESAVRWLKSRDEVDPNRIAVMGCDLGADLAFVASGKYEEIRAAISVSGDAQNAKRLAGTDQDFQPHSILYIATQGDSSAAESARQLEKLTGSPVRVQIYEDSEAHGAKILVDLPQVFPLVVDWLKKM
jgi:dienelactone hydrolase